MAGATLAYALSHAGRKVLMLERDLSEPDRIVGELLQPGGVAALAALGMASTLEGIDATPVEGYCVLSGARQVGIPYPDLETYVGEASTANGKVSNGHSNGHANGRSNGKANGANGHTTIGEKEHWAVSTASGRKEGRSFHHGRFIQALRSKVIAESEASVLEATVRDLLYDTVTKDVVGVTVAIKPEDGDSEPTVRQIRAPLTIIADGCFSKFRQQPGTRLPTPILRSHFVGVVLKDVDLPLKYHGTVCLTPHGPVLLYQIGDRAREIRMLVDVKGKLPSVANGDLKVSGARGVATSKT